MNIGLEKPNYTQVPNVLFEHLADMTAAELKCTLAIVRKIVGFHKDGPEPVSYSQLQRMTGLSRQGVADGVKASLDRGYVKIAGKGKRGANLFSLNIVDQSTQQTSTSPLSRPELVNGVDTQKKSKETTLKKRESDEQASAEIKQAPPADAPPPSSENEVPDPVDLDLIGAWLATLPTKPRDTAYSATNRRYQEALLDESITAADVREFVIEKHDVTRGDDFWLDKVMPFEHVYRFIEAWKRGRAAKAAAAAPVEKPATQPILTHLEMLFKARLYRELCAAGKQAEALALDSKTVRQKYQELGHS